LGGVLMFDLNILCVGQEAPDTGIDGNINIFKKILGGNYDEN